MGTEKKTTRHLVAGFSGGLTSAVFLQPLDLLKTRVQQSQSTSIRSVFAGMDSVWELWRGTLPSALRTSIGSALYLASLNSVRSTISTMKTQVPGATVQPSSSKLPELSAAADLTAGMFTRAAVGFVTMPVTVLKVRFESDLYNYKSLWDATSQIYKSERIQGFFRGYGATCLRDAPYAGLYVLFYQKFKTISPHILSLTGPDHEPETELFNTTKSTIINSSSAVCAAIVSTTITAPFDTIKTNMQLNPARYTGFATTFKLLVREHWTRIFDGLGLRITRKAFSAAIAWAIYEEIIKL